ncbi:MAG: hypothetical protein Q8P18_24325 [Pseudomonadota bacterium]|nr:hypothetical protein [Pseudomonadota bacterium]
MRLPHDPTVLELLPIFCDYWEHNFDVDWWPRVRTTRSLEGLRHLGHTVVGSFGQFGVPEGAPLGQALMICARDGDWAAAERHTETLRELVRQVRRALAEEGPNGEAPADDIP